MDTSKYDVFSSNQIFDSFRVSDSKNQDNANNEKYDAFAEKYDYPLKKASFEEVEYVRK